MTQTSKRGKHLLSWGAFPGSNVCFYFNRYVLRINNSCYFYWVTKICYTKVIPKYFIKHNTLGVGVGFVFFSQLQNPPLFSNTLLKGQ